MKRLFLTLFAVLFLQSISLGQVFTTLNIVDHEYVTISSTEGISAISITPNQDKSYTVVLSNHNVCGDEIVTCSFDWYLSYCGKRVSDYFQSSIRCRSSSSRMVYCWPGKVPAGNEKYVTVQLGREKDRRDDD